MPQTQTPPPATARRQAEKDFVKLLLSTSAQLIRAAPTDPQRHAATRVTRRLKLLLLNPN